MDSNYIKVKIDLEYIEGMIERADRLKGLLLEINKSMVARMK